MKSFKIYLESAVDLENRVRDYLLKKKTPMSGKSLSDNMKKYDRHNELEGLIHDLITDGEIEFKLDGKKKITRMKDFYKKWNIWASTNASKKEPNRIAYGTGIDSMDFEGRNLRVDYNDVSIMSMYLPSGTNIERLEFKFKYMDQIQEYLTTLRNTIPNLVVCGDYNICHEEIDIHNPKMKNVSGFLPEERKWLGGFIDSGFIDSFRFLNPESQTYSWWSYRANSRANNKGWRLDYAMVSEPLKQKIKRGALMVDVSGIKKKHLPAICGF